MSDTFTCPRRAENGMDDPSSPFRGAGRNLDTYQPNRGLVGQPRGCSYCGSMSGEDFLAAVRAGVEVGPTDKSYKVYVHGLDRGGSPDDLRVMGTSSFPHPGFKPWADLSPAEQDVTRGRAYPDPENWFWSIRPWGDEKVDGKFYTVHLSPEQGDEFRRLIAAQQVRIGFPGHFYARLYVPSTATAANP